MVDGKTIQWFPGHMAKTRRLIAESLKLVDMAVEIVDARIPQSSRNPEIDELLAGKPRMLLLNKADLADPEVNRAWIDYFQNTLSVPALETDCKSGGGLKSFLSSVQKTLSDVLARREEKGMGGKAIRIMVVGIPNCGKSSFINRLAGGKKAQVGDRPGVTRDRQWVNAQGGIELLDTPGVLWPKFDDPEVGKKLAVTGAIKDQIIDVEELAVDFLDLLNRDCYGLVNERYKLADTRGMDGYELLTLIGQKRGMLISGGEVNTERAANMLLDEYRGGKLGRISFERPAVQ